MKHSHNILFALMVALMCFFVALSSLGQANSPFNGKVDTLSLNSNQLNLKGVSQSLLLQASKESTGIRSYVLFTHKPYVWLMADTSMRPDDCFAVLEGSDTIYSDTPPNVGNPVKQRNNKKNTNNCYHSIYLKYDTVGSCFIDRRFDIKHTDTLHLEIRAIKNETIDNNLEVLVYVNGSNIPKKKNGHDHGELPFMLSSEDRVDSVCVRIPPHIWVNKYEWENDSIVFNQVSIDVDNERTIRLDKLPLDAINSFDIHYFSLKDVLDGTGHSMKVSVSLKDKQYSRITVVLCIAALILMAVSISSIITLLRRDRQRNRSNQGTKQKFQFFRKRFRKDVKKDKQEGNEQQPTELDASNNSEEKKENTGQSDHLESDETNGNKSAQNNINTVNKSLNTSDKKAEKDKPANSVNYCSVIRKFIEDNRINHEFKSDEELKTALTDFMQKKVEDVKEEVTKTVNGIVGKDCEVHDYSEIKTSLINWRDITQASEKNTLEDLEKQAVRLYSIVSSLKGNQEPFFNSWADDVPDNSPIKRIVTIIKQFVKALIDFYDKRIQDSKDLEATQSKESDGLKKQISKNEDNLKKALDAINQALEKKGHSVIITGDFDSLDQDSQYIAETIDSINKDAENCINELNKTISDLKHTIDKQELDSQKQKDNFDKEVQRLNDLINEKDKDNQKLQKDYNAEIQRLKDEHLHVLESEREVIEKQENEIKRTRNGFFNRLATLVSILSDELSSLQKIVQSANPYGIPMLGFIDNAMLSFTMFKQRFEQIKSNFETGDDTQPIESIVHDFSELCKQGLNPQEWINLLETLKAYSDIPLLHDAMRGYGMPSTDLLLLDAHIRNLLGAVGIQLIVPRLLLDQYTISDFDYDNSGNLWINQIIPGIAFDPREYNGRIIDIRQVGFIDGSSYQKPKVFYYSL